MKTLSNISIIIVILVFAGICESSEPKMEELKIKGFYLNMDFKEAIENAKNLYSGMNKDKNIDVKVTKWSDGIAVTAPQQDLLSLELIDKLEHGNKFEYRIIMKEYNGKLERIYIDAPSGRLFFNAYNIEPQIFVDQFRKHYNIPKMIEIKQPLSWQMPNVIMTEWKFISEKYGYSLTVGQGKDIELKKTGKKKDLKFD